MITRDYESFFLETLWRTLQGLLGILKGMPS